MLKFKTYDSNEGHFVIENGKLAFYKIPLSHVENNEVLVRPADKKFYYDEDDNGYCRIATQEEYEQSLQYQDNESSDIIETISKTDTIVDIVTTPYVPQMPYVPQTPYVPQMPYVPQTPYVPQMPYVPIPQTYFAFPTYNQTYQVLQPHFTQNNLYATLADRVVTSTKTDNETEEKTIPAIDGNFTLSVIMQLNFITGYGETATCRVSYVFSLQCASGNLPVTIEATKATDPRWILDKSSGKAHLNRNKTAIDTFIEYVQNLMASPDVPQSYIFNECGWREWNGQHIYLHADGAIGCNMPNICADKQFKIHFLPEKVGSREVFEADIKMLSITRNREKSSVIWIFSHIGVMTSLFLEARYPVKFLLALIGLTNSKKTSLAMATLRLFGTNDPSPDITFSSTAGGIEVALARYADAILVIDDFMPATNKSRQNSVDSRFDDIARAIGDRTPKKRMWDFAPSGSSKGEYIARCSGAITGEQIRGVQSALARTVIINIDKDEVINEQLSFFQRNYWLHPTYLVDYIAFIAKQYDYILNKIQLQLPLYRQQIKVKTARLAEAFAVFATTIEIIGEYIRFKGFLSEPAISQLTADLMNDVRKIICQNDAELSYQDPGILILQALDATMTSKSKTIIERSTYTAKADVILFDSNVVYVRAEALLPITREYCDKFMIPIALNDKKAVITALERLEVLDFTTDRARKLPNNAFDGRRYLYINRAKMATLVEQAEQEVH